MKSIITELLEMLKEAYLLLKDIDQFGGGRFAQKAKISEWLNAMEKITIGDIIFSQSIPPLASPEPPQDPSAPSSRQ